MTIWIIDIDNATNEQKMLFCRNILESIEDDFESLSVDEILESVKEKRRLENIR